MIGKGMVFLWDHAWVILHECEEWSLTSRNHKGLIILINIYFLLLPLLGRFLKRNLRQDWMKIQFLGSINKKVVPIEEGVLRNEKQNYIVCKSYKHILFVRSNFDCILRCCHGARGGKPSKYRLYKMPQNRTCECGTERWSPQDGRRVCGLPHGTPALGDRSNSGLCHVPFRGTTLWIGKLRFLSLRSAPTPCITTRW